MGIWKTFLSTLAIFTLFFGIASAVMLHKPGQGLQPREIKLLFEALILIVFVAMNVMYVLLWKNNATNDYFESRGEAAPPPAEQEYRQDLKRP